MTTRYSTFPELQDYILVMVGMKDDSAAVLVGAAIVERFLIDLLDSQMPNRSRKTDPLKVDDLPLSLGVSAKWAFALGYIDKGIHEACLSLSKIRNNAAHLKSGPRMNLATQPEKDLIASGITSMKASQKNVDDFIEMYEELDLSKARVRFDYLTVVLATQIDNSRVELSKT